MANPNPIRGMGGRRLMPGSLYGSEIEARARLQDIERSIREDDEHFRRTGENRPPPTINDPLVDNDNIHDIADDGDSYDEQLPFFRRQSHTADGNWAEDSPTRIIEDDNERAVRAIAELNRTNSPGINDLEGRPISRSAREAYLRREQEKVDKKQNELAENNRKRYNNAISGLETEDE